MSGARNGRIVVCLSAMQKWAYYIDISKKIDPYQSVRG